MGSIWEILGINPTEDKKEIRTAYAAKAKECHPEEEPEAFARLNDAYKTALRYVSNQKTGEAVTAGETSKTKEQNKTEPSLLARLKQAEDDKIKKSMERGALKQFIAIFEKAKETGKFPRADVWREFFLSEDFLKEQYLDEFAEGMMQYLAGWSMEGNYNMQNLPDSFLVELAVAYALMPERNDFNLEEGRTIYQVKETGFKARETAAEIWNMQQREFMPVRILYKPENLVRLRAFSDYISLRSMNSRNLLTPALQNKWYDLLVCGRVNHMYELNGKGQRQIYRSTRSTSLISLYIFWITNEEVPECILEFMYKEYDLKDIGKSSSRKLYAPLKQAILLKYPDVEEVLLGEDSKEQMISSWYRSMTKIVSEGAAYYHYKTGSYEEPEEIKKKVKELFGRAEWAKIQHSPALFDKIFLYLLGRKDLPASLAEQLYAFYSKEELPGQEDEIEKLLDELIQSLSYNRQMKEIGGSLPVVFQNTNVTDISDGNKDFWHYYLMVGFGFRNVSFHSAIKREFLLDGCCYLPAYMECLYHPSSSWRKLFTCFDEGKGAVAQPVSTAFTLPDGKTLRVEFHLHYCLYFLEGRPIYGTAYTFEEFLELSESMERTEHFFFLLAITAIEEQERSVAYEGIAKRLSGLGLYPHTISRIASMLAADNAEKREARESIEAVYYMEQGRFCFKAVVTDTSVSIYHRKKFGWALCEEAFSGREVIAGSEDRHSAAREGLMGLMQPESVSIGSVSLQGMEPEQKAGSMIELLVRHGKYRNQEKYELPHEPGYPMGTDEISAPVKEFFRNVGGFLTESYCVLRYGACKGLEELFYFAVAPFMMESSQNAAFEYEYRSQVETLHKKVKEKHAVAGCFGLSSVYTPDVEFVPEPFAIGESGTYYVYDTYHMCKADNLAALIAKKYNLSNVMEVEGFQGLLSISNLDGRFEYCYGEEAFKESVYRISLTDADRLTRFTKAEMMMEFAEWMDEILHQDMSGKSILCFVLKCGEMYSMDVFYQDKSKADGKEDSEYGMPGLISILNGQNKLVWKIWRNEGAYIDRVGEFSDILYWYMESGRAGWKLKKCLGIDCIVLDGEGKIVQGGTVYENQKSE